MFGLVDSIEHTCRLMHTLSVVVDDGYVTVELTATEMAAKRIEKELAQGRLFCPDEKKPKTGSLFIDENRKGKAQ